MSTPITLEFNDLQRHQSAFASAYGEAMCREGFVNVAGHNVPPEMLREAHELMRAFFRLPVEVRLRYHVAAYRGQRGYVPFGVERYDGGAPELKEHFNWGETTAHPMFREPLPTDLWPSEIPEFEPFFRELFRRLDTMWVALRCALAHYVSRYSRAK
jgi:isopenicillin N synthase-like dioxygenase